jgi:hypothetical protein
VRVPLFRIQERLGRIGRARALVDPNRAHRATLEHSHEFQSNHLEQRQEGDDEPGARLDIGKQILEAAGLGL